MIVSRISSKAQTTIPRAAREAFKLRIGDWVVYRREGDCVILAKANADIEESWLDPFAEFSEWAGESDCMAYAGF
jgi:antitoxin PrlF